MHPPGADTVLVRYGDVTTKSQSVRTAMLDRLQEHLRDLLDHRSIPGDIETTRGRIYVRTTESAVEAATDAAATAFGVTSASPTVRTEPTRAAIEGTIRELAADQYEGEPFAVRAHRAGDDYPFTSEDVERFGGSAVFEGAPEDVEPVVDLDDPALTIRVEVRPDHASVFVQTVDGPGGLPYGTQEPVVVLVSGGFDSPVAAYELLRRGAPVLPVYLDLGDYGGPDHRARAVETVRRLAWHAPHDDWGLYHVPSGESVERIADHLDKGRMLAFRRYMFRVADEIAKQEGAAGIATGEAIGQKSSQTVSNLGVTSRAATRPVHRPLLTADKSEITETARAIDTFDDSAIPTGCAQFAPPVPETNASIEWLRGVEPDDLFEWARADAEAAEWHPVEPAAPE